MQICGRNINQNKEIVTELSPQNSGWWLPSWGDYPLTCLQIGGKNINQSTEIVTELSVQNLGWWLPSGGRNLR